jgi:AcrR family transcriptional regulator
MPSAKSNAAPLPKREPKQARGKLRVAALLDAAAAVFSEKGYDGATMTEIATRARAAIGSLYQFFPSKEALADALLARYGERIGEALDGIASRAARLAPHALADALVDLMLELRSDRAAALILLDARGDLAGQARALRDATRDRLIQILSATGHPLSSPRTASRALILLQLLKAVPGLAQEEMEGASGLLREIREVIRLYISDRTETRVE